MAFVSTYPVSLTYNYGPNVGTNNSVFNTSDGVFYNLSPLTKNVQDVTFNQNSLNILSNNILLSDCLSGVSQPDKTDYVTETTLSIKLNETTNYFYVSGSGLNVPVLSLVTELSSAVIFNIKFNNDGTISLSNGNNYLTADSTATLKISVYNSATYSTNQSFNYTLHNDQIALFAVTNNQVAFINASPLITPKVLSLGNFTSFNDNVNYYSNVLTLDRFSTTLYKELGETNNVKYVSTTNDIDVANTSADLEHNYLVTAPYTTVNRSTNNLGYNIAALKNHYSPEHIQTPTLSVQSRTYNKLYTGLNTAAGNDKIYLGYLGNETTKKFVKDTDTYFHYPEGAPAVPLSASTLIAAGAQPGSSPWRSDRIFVKQANYGDYSSWGDFNGTQNGEFFCSWLSASEVGAPPAWVDRYFDPTRVNVAGVIYSQGLAPSNNNYPNVIWDVPSTQVLCASSLYVYHRIGDSDNLAVVRGLSALLTHSGTDSTYFYTNTKASALVQAPNTRSYAFNTSVAYGTIKLVNQDFYTPGFTIAFQAYNTDWSNIQGDQIIGNYYNGGIGLFKNNPLLTPFISIMGDNKVTTYNTNLKRLAVTNTSLVSGSYVLKGLYEDTYFVIDPNQIVYEYDQDGVLISQSSFNLTGTLIGAQLINENNVREIIIFTKSGGSINWAKYLTNFVLSTSGTHSGNSNYALDLSNNIYYYDGKGNSTVDGNNVVFALSGDLLVRGLGTTLQQAVLSARDARYIACDHENNIWLLYSDNYLCKLDNYGRVVWDIQTQLPTAQIWDAGTGNALNSYRGINFIAEIDSTTNTLKYSGLLQDGPTQTLYKISPTNGSIELYAAATTPLSAVHSAKQIDCIPGGDSTGYDYQRKYVYPNSNSKELVIKALIENTATLDYSSKIVKLSYDASSLSPGWHHFAISVDPYNKLNLYVDGTLAASTSTGDITLGIYRVYNKRNNLDLVVGTSSFKSQTLAQYTNTVPYAFNGYIADIRFYSDALYQADIKAIQRSFHINSYSDLTWASPAGSRYYIEQIDRFFMHRLPGAKSHSYNIRIKNSNITDLGIRNIIEQNILTSLSKTTPLYTKLNNIIWE